MLNKVLLKLGKPVVIAQSEPLQTEHGSWGPFQFPTIEYIADGRLHTEYHIRKDSALAYGKSKGHAVSADMGKTWTSTDDSQIHGGILLKNGDRLRLKALQAIEVTKIDVPGDPDDVVLCYKENMKVYDAKRFSNELNYWPFERLRKGESIWQIEKKDIDIPKVARYLSEGVLPFNMFWRLKLDLNGRVWGIAYPFFYTGEKPSRARPLFCVSEDNGITFKYLSDIPYTPDPNFDSLHEKRLGFGEPDIAFMPDGSILCLLRTTDGHGIGCSYICHSYNGGVTWTKPEYFDDNGVWPTLLTLKNGITLAVYGRPGLFLRATNDKAGICWDERVNIVPPGKYQTDTCSYADMIAINDNAAYLVYSDFKYPNKDGVHVKSILGIKIETDII